MDLHLVSNQNANSDFPTLPDYEVNSKIKYYALAIFTAIANFFLDLYEQPLLAKPRLVIPLDMGRIAGNLKNYYRAGAGDVYKKTLTPHVKSHSLNFSGAWVFAKNIYPYTPEKREEEIREVFTTTLSGLVDLWIRGARSTEGLSSGEVDEYVNQLYRLVNFFLNDEKRQQRFRKLFDDHLINRTPEQNEAIKHIHQINRKIKKTWWVNRLKSITQLPIPKEELLKLIVDENSLTSEEKERLDRWIEALNDHPAVTPTHLFHAIQWVSQILRDDFSIIYALSHYKGVGCKLLYKPDEHFMRRREKWLKRGYVRLRYFDKKISYALEGEPQELHRTIRVSIKNDPTKVVFLDDNPLCWEACCSHYIEKWEEHKYPLPLLMPLEGLWGITIALAETPMSKEKIKEIANSWLNLFVNTFEQLSLTPPLFDPKHLFWIKNRLHILSFSYDDVEADYRIHLLRMMDTLRSMTMDLPDVYNLVFVGFQPYLSEDCKYYSCCLDDVIDEKERNKENEYEEIYAQANLGHAILKSYRYIEEAGRQLREEAKALRDKIANRPEIKATKPKTIAKVIKEYYLAQNGFGHILPEWEEAICDQINRMESDTSV